MSHLPLSLMNRLNKIESAIFKFWMLCFQRISFKIICKCILKVMLYATKEKTKKLVILKAYGLKVQPKKW